MKGVEEGDTLDLEYLRDGNVGTVEVEPRIMPPHAYAWSGDGKKFEFRMPPAPMAPDAMREYRFVAPLMAAAGATWNWWSSTRDWATTSAPTSGLLVVSAPKSEALQAGGRRRHPEHRRPRTDVGRPRDADPRLVPGRREAGARDHARQASRKLDVAMPDDRTSRLAPLLPLPPLPVSPWTRTSGCRECPVRTGEADGRFPPRGRAWV